MSCRSTSFLCVLLLLLVPPFRHLEKRPVVMQKLFMPIIDEHQLHQLSLFDGRRCLDSPSSREDFLCLCSLRFADASWTRLDTDRAPRGRWKWSWFFRGFLFCFFSSQVHTNDKPVHKLVCKAGNGLRTGTLHHLAHFQRALSCPKLAFMLERRERVVSGIREETHKITTSSRWGSIAV